MTAPRSSLPRNRAAATRPRRVMAGLALAVLLGLASLGRHAPGEAAGGGAAGTGGGNIDMARARMQAAPGGSGAQDRLALGYGSVPLDVFAARA